MTSSPPLPADFVGILSNTAAMLMPCSAKIGELATPRPGPRTTSAMCAGLRRRMPDPLGALDAVADAPFPNFPNVQVAPICVALMLV